MATGVVEAGHRPGGGGGRPGDTDGTGASGLDCLAFNLFAGLSGLVPLVGITSGRCFAGNAALVDELSLEDRINDEVRVILEAYSEEMRNSGANYQEMFRKVKSELVRKYKAVL